MEKHAKGLRISVVQQFKAGEATTAYDAIVIGMGIAGVYILYKLRAIWLSARVYEAAKSRWYSVLELLTRLSL